MNIAIVSASHRKKSRSRMAADWIASHVEELGSKFDIIDLSEFDLPFWSEDLWDRGSALSQIWKPYSDRLKACDGLVLVSPEWAGMVPPKLTNFLLLCSSHELAYKPTFLIGISAGPSGTYPIAQLRMSSSKNNQMIFMPDHLIIRHAENFLNPGPEKLKDSKLDAESTINKRAKFNVQILLQMARDCSRLRETIDYKQYQYGL